MSIAFLGLGTNLGDKKENLVKAISLLKKREDISIIKESSRYITTPVGFVDQPDFLNAVIMIKTELTPYELLEICQTVEQKLKRERLIRWGPRTIDIDILLFDEIVMETDELWIPHPRMHERKFVLEPLAEIAPEVLHPIFRLNILDMYKKL
jgi:2-amino-4-hydroxy-6-hydroxymethyldihydropteridine diphosphokinase